MFSIVEKKIIYSWDITTISILLSDNKSIKLFNITPIPEYESNLISLGQLLDTGFIYYNKPIKKTLMKREKVVAYVKWNQTLFVFNLIKLENAMAICHKKSKYVISKNK